MKLSARALDTNASDSTSTEPDKSPRAALIPLMAVLPGNRCGAALRHVGAPTARSLTRKRPGVPHLRMPRGTRAVADLRGRPLRMGVVMVVTGVRVAPTVHGGEV